MRQPIGQTVLVRYTGDPNFAYALVFAIESEGGTVTIPPAPAPAHLASEVEAFLIVATPLGEGPDGVSAQDVANAGIAKFAEHFPGRGDAQIRRGASVGDEF